MILVVRYGDSCAQRPWLVRPFPAEPAEMARVRESTPTAQERPVPGAARMWRYIGRGGPDLRRAASAFFDAWLAALERGLVTEGEIRFQALGTSYARAGSGTRTLAPLVSASRLEPWVDEDPDRLSYSGTLAALVQSDALVVFGSEEPAYTASKIYPYLLSGRPVLAVFHERSPVVGLIRAVGGAVCVTFDEETTKSQLANAILEEWFQGRQYEQPVPLDRLALEPFSAAAQARELGTWFRSELSREFQPDNRVRADRHVR